MTNDEIAALLTSGCYKLAEQEAIRQIRLERLHAQMWVYLGEALLRQGFGLTATKVFQRAHLLDPEASWIVAVNNELNKMPKENAHDEAEELLCKHKVTVAAAILVYNEIRCIKRCLDAIIDAVDEIVIIDCGSTDGTLEIIQAYPKVKQISFTWCDDFSAARNAGLNNITSDWVIWIDADEALIAEDKQQIREVAAVLDQADRPIVALCGVLEQLGGHTAINYAKSRMYATKYPFKFVGRVHEQIRLDPSESSQWMKNRHITVLIRFDHDGYSPDVLHSKNKIARNLRLLKMMLEEEPNNPAWWLFYGRETLGKGDVDQALNSLKSANERAKQQINFPRRLEILMLLINIHITREEWREAEEYCDEALRLRPDFPDALYYLAQVEIHKAQTHDYNAELLLRKIKDAAKTYRGVVSPDSNIVMVKADLALTHIAEKYGKK